MNIPLLSVDMNKVITKLANNKLCTTEGDPLPAFQFLQLPQSETNQKVNSILRGLSEWWKIAGDRKRATMRASYILRTSIAKMYASKFKLDTIAAVYKSGGEDLGRPIGKRAKSVVGNDEDRVPKGAKAKLQGILYTRYHEIPTTVENMLRSSWKPEYIARLEKSKHSEEFIRYLNKESGSIIRDPIQQLGIRLRNTISSQGAPCIVCGSTEDVHMHHVTPVKNIKAKNARDKYKIAINTPQIPLCRRHHLQVHQNDWRNNPVNYDRFINETK